jgi:hypothetical protein
MIYFLTYNLGRHDAFRQIGVITLIASATIILAQPLWVKLAQELGKRRTYILSALLYAALSIAWGVFGRMGLGVDYLLAALLGVFNSGWSLMGFSMVSDLSDDGRGGLYSSIWVAADKIGFALGGTLLVGAPPRGRQRCSACSCASALGRPSFASSPRFCWVCAERSPPQRGNGKGRGSEIYSLPDTGRMCCMLGVNGAPQAQRR